MTNKLIIAVACLSLAAVARAEVNFDQGISIKDVMETAKSSDIKVPAPQKVSASADNADMNPMESVIADMEQRVIARGGVPGDLDARPAVHAGTGFPNLQLPLSRTGYVYLFVKNHKKYVAENGDINEIWDEEDTTLKTTKRPVIAKYYVMLLKYQLGQPGYNAANIDPVTGLPNLEL